MAESKGPGQEKTLEMRVAELEDKLSQMHITEEEMQTYQKVAQKLGAASPCQQCSSPCVASQAQQQPCVASPQAIHPFYYRCYYFNCFYRPIFYQDCIPGPLSGGGNPGGGFGGFGF